MKGWVKVAAARPKPLRAPDIEALRTPRGRLASDLAYARAAFPRG
jgi:hypothetical protein